VRTTLAIDDDVLAAAKKLAVQQRESVGQIISALARQALQLPPAGLAIRNGIMLLPVRPDAVPVTPELVNQLRECLPD
jgi:hypothetical protein